MIWPGRATPAHGSPDDPVRDGLASLLGEGMALLEKERRLCLTGALDQALSLAAEKEAFAERLADELSGVLSDAAAGAPAIDTRALGAELEQLAARARRNERLIVAAREGLRAAARRLARLEAAQQGAVAYRADGTTVLSREDAAGRSKRA